MYPFEESNFVHEYLLDAWQRSILSLDILRERGNDYFKHNAEAVPNVLEFKAELVRDGRTLSRPVNYLLVRIVPPKGTRIDPAKLPFIVVDPRAGHGPGIGGMKGESEIGVALKAGHPCYYIGFLPEPIPGQTVEDVCIAEAEFVKEVAKLHPDAESAPVIIANCQAGWQIMMMAAANPDLVGPIMLAGSPLSFWAGVRGKNPMRYLGGLLGGSWTAALSGDLGNGLFDGAHLVANFESLDPTNTHWDKPYNVYSKVDTEGPRFLNFETWWGSPVLLNAGEMQWIVDNLFIGNKLTSGQLRMPDGKPIDLRNIKSPIIVFCSHGDNITPPQQALGWITDLYKDEREIVANGQTIVYTMHQTTGHLGIFVSGKVAIKEHREFTHCMDMINMAPPGLYEAVITDVEKDTPGAKLTDGDYLFRLEARTLDDIRALGANSPADDRCFAALARLSKINLHLYRMFASPFVRAMTTDRSAELMRHLHPNRLRFTLFSDKNPLMRSVAQIAKTVQGSRVPASPNNPLSAMEKAMASCITASWEMYRIARDTMSEAAFLRLYDSPALQAALGVTSQPLNALPAPAYETDKAQLLSNMDHDFETGGLVEAALRALVYVNLPKIVLDERSFSILKKFREAQHVADRLPARKLKEVMKKQSLLVRLDAERAIEAIPKLLPKQPEKRRAVLQTLHKALKARGAVPEETKKRLAHIDALFTKNHEKPTIIGGHQWQKQNYG